MSEVTTRDKAWLGVIDSLRQGEDTDARTIADRAGVSLDTARRVLHVAEDEELYYREGEYDHAFRVNVGPMAEVQDDEYRRAVETLIQESSE